VYLNLQYLSSALKTLYTQIAMSQLTLGPKRTFAPSPGLSQHGLSSVHGEPSARSLSEKVDHPGGNAHVFRLHPMVAEIIQAVNTWQWPSCDYAAQPLDASTSR
jgi:hypothetical protein